MLAGIVLLFLDGLLGWFGIALGTAVMAAGLWLAFRWLRCPHCGKLLGRAQGRFCIHCGQEIDYDTTQ